jgi:hypothetical protein
MDRLFRKAVSGAACSCAALVSFALWVVTNGLPSTPHIFLGWALICAFASYFLTRWKFWNFIESWQLRGVLFGLTLGAVAHFLFGLLFVASAFLWEGPQLPVTTGLLLLADIWPITMPPAILVALLLERSYRP